MNRRTFLSLPIVAPLVRLIQRIDRSPLPFKPLKKDGATFYVLEAENRLDVPVLKRMLAASAKARWNQEQYMVMKMYQSGKP